MGNFTSKIYRGFGKLITEFLEDTKERIKVIDHVIATLIFSYLSIQKEVLFKFSVAFPKAIQFLNQMVITETISWLFGHYIKNLVNFVGSMKNEFAIPLKQTINFLFSMAFVIYISFYNKLLYLENVIVTFSRKLYDSVKFTHFIKNEFLIPLKYTVNFFGKFTFAITSMFYNSLQLVENVLTEIKSSLVSAIQIISYVRYELSALIYDSVIFQFVVSITQKVSKYFYNQLQLVESILSRLSTDLISNISISSIVKLTDYLASLLEKITFDFVVSIIQKISKYFYNQLQLIESIISRLSSDIVSIISITSIVKLLEYLSSLTEKVVYDFVVSIIQKISKYFYNQLQAIESIVSRLSSDIVSFISIGSIVRLTDYLSTFVERVVFTFVVSIIQKISKYFYNAINLTESLIRNISGDIISSISLVSVIKLEQYLTSIIEKVVFTFYVSIITKFSKYFYNLINTVETIVRNISGDIVSLISIASIVKLEHYLTSIVERVVFTFYVQIITKSSKYFYNLLTYLEALLIRLESAIVSTISIVSIVKLLDYIGSIIERVTFTFIVSMITKFSKYFYNSMILTETVLRWLESSITSAISLVSIIKLLDYLGSIIERCVYTFYVSIITKFSRYFYNAMNAVETVLRTISGNVVSAINVVSIIKLESYASNIIERVSFTFIASFITKFSKYFYNLLNAVETVNRALLGNIISNISLVSIVQYAMYGATNVYDRILYTFGLRVREPTFFDKWKFDQPTFDEVEYDV